MIRRLLRYEIRAAWSRKALCIAFLAMLFLLLGLGASIPTFGEVVSVATRPDGLTRADILEQYRARLEAIGGAGGEEALLLSLLISAGVDQYDCLPLKEIALRHAGLETIALSYSLLEMASYLAIGLGILLSLVLFSLPRRAGLLSMEQLSLRDRKKLIVSKIVIGVLGISLFSLLIMVASLAISGGSLGQLFIYRYRDSFQLAPFYSILILKAAGAAIGGCLFFVLELLLDCFLPRAFLGPIFLSLLFIGSFLLSNAAAPSWGFYGEPSGQSYAMLFLIPFSNVILGSNFGFLPETIVLLTIWLAVALGGGLASVKLFERSDL